MHVLKTLWYTVVMWCLLLVRVEVYLPLELAPAGNLDMTP